MLLDLVRRAQIGDIQAFDSLYAGTCRWLLQRVRALVGSMLAEDVLAEVYVQAWRELDRFDGSRGAVATWLAVIARSRALDRLRRERRMRQTHERCMHLDAGGESLADSPESAYGALEDARLLQAHIARELSSQERMVVGLAYFRDNTQQEIADATGMPLGTVKTTMVRAHKKLRDCFNVPVLDGADGRCESVQTYDRT